MFLRCLVLVLLVAPMAAWGAQSSGIRLYERGAYARAVRVLKNEANNPRRSEEQRALARVYLAASLMALEKGDEARRQLEELARTYPEQRVDPALFPPELVELERLVRAELETERLRKEAEQAERERLVAEAERERLAAEAERRRREAEEAAAALQHTPRGPELEVQGPTDVEPASSFRLRPELLGFGDFKGRGAGGPGVGVTVGIGALEGTVRALIGKHHIGWEAEAGVVIGSWAIQPRVSVRGMVVPGIEVPDSKEPVARFGFAGAVGGRLALSSRVIVLADVGYGWLFGMPPKYNNHVVVASAGLGFNLF